MWDTCARISGEPLIERIAVTVTHAGEQWAGQLRGGGSSDQQRRKHAAWIVLRGERRLPDWWEQVTAQRKRKRGYGSKTLELRQFDGMEPFER